MVGYASLTHATRLQRSRLEIRERRRAGLFRQAPRGGAERIAVARVVAHGVFAGRDQAQRRGAYPLALIDRRGEAVGEIIGQRVEREEAVLSRLVHLGKKRLRR